MIGYSDDGLFIDERTAAWLYDAASGSGPDADARAILRKFKKRLESDAEQLQDLLLEALVKKANATEDRRWVHELAIEAHRTEREARLKVADRIGRVLAGEYENVDVDRIRAGVDWRRLLEDSGVDLKRANRAKLSVKCPFHEDKTASLSVDTAKGLYYCFAGCGGGDAIKFVQERDKCSFRRAVDTLSKYI